ncbi:PREDICTED: S-locus-specific glycoprotein S13-like [Brassica oleracea var. oleracea]|uniref:S-locus-specific glycoprotein S13-like n=1 Tax=Brassica oleracea var. oleracea TaxID=109376 RepID=UPI0006A6E451|nr:PREDICTED: S-locus-specific glycoprotein S13-like [Brassica oleracea var. oleracea]XP_013615270.1 PREDICTED: S-locus-specific glycoprotein S13-like [Brassica oleracea var. oleracea]
MKVRFFFILVLHLSSKYDSKIVSTEPFKISTRRNILSPEKVFVFGFFKPSTTSGVADRWYLGIWHHRFPQEVVWVANRDNPMSKPVGTLKILDTNLVLLDQYGTRVWWTNRTSTNLMKSLVTGELLDSGNFVLRYFNNDLSTGCLWQSFDFPTDALVSNMKLGFDAKSNINRVLESWRSSDDPSSGEITYGVERHELVQSVIRKKGMPTFRNEPWKIKNESGNFTYVTYNITVTKEEATYFFTITNKTFFSILRLSYNGVLKRSTWVPKPQQLWKRVDRIQQVWT